MDSSEFNFQTIHCKLWGHQEQNMNRSSQQYRASDSTGVQAGLTPNSCQISRSKPQNYLHIIVWIVFLFCHMFQTNQFRFSMFSIIFA